MKKLDLGTIAQIAEIVAATGVLIGSEQTFGRHVDVRHLVICCGLDRLAGEAPY